MASVGEQLNPLPFRKKSVGNAISMADVLSNNLLSEKIGNPNVSTLLQNPKTKT